MDLELVIIKDSPETIRKSFDSIACNLLMNWCLVVNNSRYHFTEIEFYLFMKSIHEDNSAHNHSVRKGKWRHHLKGLDISLGSEETFDGGILLRGIKMDGRFVNGPVRILTEIFNNLNTVTTSENVFGLVYNPQRSPLDIFKAPRHGLGKSVSEEFRYKPYRYYTEIGSWNPKDVSPRVKDNIRLASERLVNYQ
jgi:hypothetical protein